MKFIFKIIPARPALLLAILSIFGPLAFASGGAVRGQVTDPSDAIIPHAQVTLRSLDGAHSYAATSGDDGTYDIENVAPGSYHLEVQAPGFQVFTTDGLNVESGAVSMDARLQMKTVSEAVTIEVNTDQLETSSSQIGGLLSAKKLDNLPVNGRSFTDLMALQPGMLPASSQQPNAVVMSGCTSTPPSGDLDAGNVSISGQRETSNGFAVNGSITEEDFNNGTAIVPNLDAIEEVRVLTANFDAEYGNFSGGQVLVTTKSGSNNFHGSGFEFLRNTDLDARNYFSSERAQYDRNQYGGTFGGPIRKNASYFFLDFQGTQMTQGQETGQIIVPTAADRGGNLLDMSSQLTGHVSTDYLASQLSKQLNYSVAAGEPFYTAGCTSTAQCVFPGAVIPQSVWSKPAANLLQYIPTANAGADLFSTSAESEKLNDQKFATRIDQNTRFGTLSGYYFFDQYTLNNPYPTAQGGANVPGFNAISDGRAQLFTLSLTKPYGANTVNEAHFSYMRYANVIGSPVGGVGTSLASQGFVTGANSLGIVPLNPKAEGIENVAFNDFTIGVDVTGERQTNNTYEWSDSLSRTLGKHTLKIGGSFHLDQVNIVSNSINNGSFVFQGTTTGSDFADFLLGIASTYEQGDAGPFYLRNKYIGVFAQDSWRLRRNLTVNYGARWDVLPPWREKYNQIQTFVLGEQSQVYPGAPTGIVFPGDPGIPSTLAPTKWTNLAPRVGIAYSPEFGDNSIGRLFGKSVIRASYGVFYTAFEGLSAGIMSACAPYGYDYDSTSGSPLFAEPFVSATTGQTYGQPFPSPIPALGASPSHPNKSVDWSKYTPITGDPAFYPGNTSPYTEEYSLSLERELPKSTTLSVNYVGTQAHHLLVLTPADPGNAAACLSVSQPSQVAPGTPTCGPFNEDGVFTKADGSKVQVRGPFSPSFAGITYQKTIGFSNYNALEVSARHSAGPLEITAAYTYSKSLDDSSSLAEEVYPMGAALSKAISAFDMRHNFVVSYHYDLPIAAVLHAHNRWTSDWALSGVTRFASGLPVTLFNNTDSSLLGSMPNGINNNGVDTPYYVPGNLDVNTNPRNGRAAFNTALFPSDVNQYLGQIGNAARRFFYGPGIENFDIALQKSVSIREKTTLQFRLETFNTFNHAQFFGPASVNGNISSAGFGQITQAMAPREVEAAVKVLF